MPQVCMKLSYANESYFQVVYFSALHIVICKPTPQGTTSEEVQDTRDINIKEDNVKAVDNNKNDGDNDDLGKTVADLFGGVLGIVNGVLDTAEEIAGNEVYLTILLKSLYGILDVVLENNITRILIHSKHPAMPWN